MWVRPGVPFVWEIREQQVVIQSVLSHPASTLLPDDVLLGSNGGPLRHAGELEFLIDGKVRGETVFLQVLRHDRQITAPITLSGYWHSRREVIVNLMLGLCLWAIGTWVVLRRPGNRAAHLFFLLALSLTIATMVGTARLPAGPRPWSYFLPIVYTLIYPFFPALFLRFATNFPAEKMFLRAPRRQTIFIYLPAFVFSLALAISLLRALASGSLLLYREYHLLYSFHRAYLVIFSLLAIMALFHSYLKAAQKSEKDQMRWILWGIVAGSAPFLVLWTIPQILAQRPLAPEEIISLALILAPLSFAFAILKYKLFAIEVVINRSIVYVLLTGFIAGVHLLLVGLAGHFLQHMSTQTNSFAAIICTLVVVLLFNPAKQKVREIVDRTFYRVKYNYRLAIKQFSQLMVAARSRQETLDLLMQHIDSSVPIETLAVLLPHNGAYEIAVSRGLREDEKKLLNLAEARETEPTRTRALSSSEARHTDLPQSGTASLRLQQRVAHTGMKKVLPVEISTGQWGYLMLGRKRAGNQYSEEDLELLSMLATEAFRALERIRLQEMAIQERAEKGKLEELNRLKSEFVALVSHELRTPLTAIRWSVQNLLDGIPEKPSAKLRDYLVGIQESSALLSRMIENVLDVSKIEAGKVEVFPERFCPAEIVPALFEAMAPMAGKKNIKIQMGAFDGLHVKADRDALRVILSNLIENAIKYSPAGAAIQLAAQSAPQSPDMVVFSVCDEGMGIPPEKQKAIFRKFERALEERKAREKGLGLGLYIVKELVRAQGGTIGVKSAVGSGRVFTFTLPAA